MALIVNYSKLVETITEEAGYQYVLQLAKTFKYPATSFLPGSIGYTILKTMGAVLSIFSDSTKSITEQLYVDTSSSEFLTLLAKGHFDITRFPETQTVIEPRLTVSTAVPASYDAETITIKVGDVEFFNTEDFSITYEDINTIGYKDISFTSTEYGADTRVSTGIIPIFQTNPIANATFQVISNEDGYFGIISEGQDEESDADLAERCSTKFATLSLLGPETAIKSWVLNATDADGNALDVTRVKIDRSEAQSIGNVIIYLANADGYCSDETITYANANVQKYRSICSTVYVEKAHEIDFTYNLIVTVDSTAEQTDSILKQSIRDAIYAYTSIVPIGGTITTGTYGYVFLSEVIDRIMDITGVVNVSCTSMVIDAVTRTSNFDVQMQVYDVPKLNANQTDGITLVRI